MKLGGGKVWYTAAELAELALPGLPTTKRKINERAAAEGWAIAANDAGEPLARPRMGRGGGLEYSIAALPASARTALIARGVAVVADISPEPDTRVAQLWRWFDGLPAKDKAEAQRRQQMIAEIEDRESLGLTRSSAIAGVSAQRSVGTSTIWVWLRAIGGVAAADRLVFLAPKRAGGGVAAEVDPGAWQYLISDYLRLEKPTFSACYYRTLREYAEPRGVTIPPERTLRRKFEREIDGRLVIARREGAEALRRSLPAQQRSVAELHALEAVNIDGHKFDVFVRWPDGRVGRVVMVAIQDLYSRKILAWRIDESESALLTRMAFADLFQNFGIPRRCLLDNGRAFASKWITGGAKSRYRFKIKDDEPTGVLTALGVQIHWATPYRGQSKPIERAFRDMCDAIAKHPKLAGCYTGNKPDAKPENYGSAAMPIERFRQIVTAGIAAHNAKPNRRSETAQGRFSFDDVFNASYAVAPIGKATPEQLRLALLTAEERQCDRQTAVVTLEGNRYWAPELADHAGKRVTLRFDPDDLHSEVHVYTRTGEFIVTAPVQAAVGFFDKSSAGARRKQEAELRRRVRHAAELEQLLDAQTIAAMLPDHLGEAPLPKASVMRPVRHRGTAAALKPEAVQAPLNPVIDRLSFLSVVK